MASAQQPLTRRELHRAHGKAAHRAPSRTMALRAAALQGVDRSVGHCVGRCVAALHAITRGGAATLPRVWQLTKRMSFEAVAAATAVAFLGGAVTGVALNTAERQTQAAQAQAQARQDRADRAATVRLTAAAAQYAAAREQQAISAAHAALDEALAVLGSAPSLVGDATVGPLDEAVLRLTALVEFAAPTAQPGAAPEIATTDVRIVADDDPGDASDPTAAPIAPDAATTDDAATLAGSALAGTSVDPGVADAAGSGLWTGTVPTGAEVTALALVDVPPDVLDLDTSATLLAAAQEVAALATQVTALSDAVAVELADAAEAAEARRAEAEAKRVAAEEAARQAALAQLSSRIAATDRAQNGRIPLELLCRPQFVDIRLRCDAASALDQLNAAYRAANGRDLAVSGGYRTLAEQQAVRAAKGDLAAQPGTSNHGRGLAVDFSDMGGLGQFDDADYLWMVANGPHFGWVHPPGMGPGGSGPLEPWHWEFGDL